MRGALLSSFEQLCIARTSCFDPSVNLECCPLQVRDPSHSMIAHGPGLKSAQVGRAARFNIETGGQGDAKDFDIVVSSAGSPLPVRCFVQKDKSLLVEWYVTRK